MENVINGIFIENNKLLLVKKKKGSVWILPGGKIDNNESHYETLNREITIEELPGLEFKIGELYDYFKGISPNNKNKILVFPYFTERLSNKITPSAEIEEAKFILYHESNNYNISNVTKTIIESLHNDKYF